MKFLVDMPASPELVVWLQERGHEAVHAQDIGLATATDAVIVEKAREEGRVIITVDLDFGKLLALAGSDRPGLILFRGGNYSDAEMRKLLSRVLDLVDPEVLVRAISVVDKQRVRVTRLPLKQ